MFLYTSGSTGRSKGVVLSHQSHLWVVEERRRGVPLGTEPALVAAPLYHMNALQCVKRTSGSTMRSLLPSFTTRSYIEAIGQHRCTAITSVPTMIAMMLQEEDLLARTNHQQRLPHDEGWPDRVRAASRRHSDAPATR